MATKSDIKFSIRTKLFLMVFITFVTLIALTVWQIGAQANRIAFDTINQSLNQSSVILNTKIESRFENILEVAKGISQDSRILPLVYEKASATLQDQSLEFKDTLEFDILFFTDDQGMVLARSDRPEAVGQVLAGRIAMFDSALAGVSAQGYFQSRGKLLQLVVVPIFDNVAKDVVRGTIALAYEFGGDVADEIHNLAASEVDFFSFTRDRENNINGAVSTYSTNIELANNLNNVFIDSPALWQQIADGDTTGDITINVKGVDYQAVFHRFANDESTPLGFVLAMRSSQELLKPFIDLQRSVLIIGTICLVLILLSSYFLSHRISKPIVDIVNIAESIQEGTFRKQAVATLSNDEVGLLYSAVIRMGNNLEEKAGLEAYLAQLSDELQHADSLENGSFSNDLLDDKTHHTNDDGSGKQLGTASSDGDQTVASSDTDFEKAVLEMSDDSLIHDTLMSLDKTTVINRGNSRTESNQMAGIIDQRYEVIKPLGNGAIGSVYLVHDMALDEKVAIKLMPKNFFSQHENISVKEEIRLARRITHPNILRTFDFGIWENYYFITMEYVSGYDLNSLIQKKGGLDLHIGVVMAKQICSAIYAAHQQGIIHLDLKPANMIINAQGIIKIMDFGLAKRLAKQGVELSDIDLSIYDAPKALVGTPRYMAPEQFVNERVDERTDIYAIGIILFTLLSGRVPFTSNNLIELAKMHMQSPLPDMRDNQDNPLPQPLQYIIDKASAKRPEDRYQSVRDILTDLNNLD